MLIRNFGKSLSVVQLEGRYQMRHIFLIPKRRNCAEKCERPKKPQTPTSKDMCTTHPQEQKKSKKLFTIATVGLVGTSLAVYAAKNDEDIREFTKENIPQLDTLVKIVYQEEESYGEFLHRLYTELTQGFKNALFHVYQGIKESRIEKSDSPKGIYDDVPHKAVLNHAPSAFALDDDDKHVPTELRHLKLLEDKLFHDAEDAMKDYSSAIDSLKEKVKFTDNLDQLVNKHDCKLWDKFKNKIEEGKNFVESFTEDVEKVRQSADNLQLQMNATPNLSDEMKKKSENNIQNTLDTINNAKGSLNKYVNNQKLTKRSWDKVRRARIYFSDQLETIFPNIWLEDEKLDIPPDKLPKFAEDIVQDIVYLEKELYKLQALLDPQVKNAVESTPTKDEDDSSSNNQLLTQAFVDVDSGKKKRNFRDELKKEYRKNEAFCEKTNQDALKKLTAVYKDLKVEALAVAEREAERKIVQLREKRLAELRTNHQLEVAKMVGRIQGANQALAEREDQEKTLQERQQFWSAAQSLHSAVKPIGAITKSKQPKPLKNEILKLTKVTPDGDDFVKTVVETIPENVVESGVVPLEFLRQRFKRLQQQARNLACLPAGPVTLPRLALARVQSALYRDTPISQGELDNQPIDIQQLNNYDLLQRASYYVDREELAQAIRYLNLLEGPSRQVVCSWVKDAVAFLETVQATELLLSHASSYSDK